MKNSIAIIERLALVFVIFKETATVNQTAVEILEKKQMHHELIEETVAVGMMFASKAFVQLLANPIVGPMTHK